VRGPLCRLVIFRAVVGLCASMATLLGQGPSNASGLSPKTLTPAEARLIDDVANAELKSWRAPGMVLAVVRDDSVVYTAAYGVANIETHEAMAADMLVSVASVTKMVTATTALVLASSGKIDLDAPIRTYLPWLSERLGALSLVQLLSHTAGLGELTPTVSPAPNGALAPVCKAMTDALFVARPGEAWGYSNSGYTLAGCVIESAAKIPYAQAVTQTLFNPLEMSSSTFNPGVAMTYRHAQGHDTRGEVVTVVRPFNSSPSLAPAGELITTVGDLSKLARALLSDGVVAGTRVLPTGLMARMGTVRARGGPFLGGPRDYGFGVFIRSHRGLRILEHEGVFFGFGASVALSSEHGIAAIAVTNGRYSAPARTTQVAVEVAAGLAPSETESSWRQVSPRDAARMVGRYASPAQTIEIAMENGSVGIRQGTRVFPIRARDEGHWEIPGYPGFLPIPATPMELVEGGSDRPPAFVRIGWRLYRRLE